MGSGSVASKIKPSLLSDERPMAEPMTPTDGLAQAELLQGLLYPCCYPHAPDCIERIETHISTVLMAGDYAYKFKKPVNLGFLDFTTL